MNVPMTLGNTTQLVFCRENVNPDVVSEMLGLVPSEAVKVGEAAEHLNGAWYTSHLGIWKLDLPNAGTDQTVETQIGLWVELLRPKSVGLSQLRGMGYCPYLDCKADAGSLSICVEPELLVSLGQLNVSLSVWLYEQPQVRTAA